VKRNAPTLEERNLKTTRNSVFRKRKMNVQPQQQPPIVPAQVPPVQPQLPAWEAEANTLNLQGERRTLFRLLRDFHEFSAAQCKTLREEGYSSLSHLLNWKHKDIRSLLENLSNRPNTRGGQRFGDRKIKELQALAWFLTDRYRRGLSLDLDLYCQEAGEYISLAEIDSEITKDDTADKPEKFKHSSWNR